MFEAFELMVFFENMIALNNVSLTCGEGKIIGIFGSNSAGKSTFMHAISGIILDIKKKEEMRGGERISVFGRVFFNGKDISAVKPHIRAKDGIVLCPERRRIFPESSVLENLKIGSYLTGSRETKQNIDYVLDLFPRLKDHLHRQGGFLSGGEQQMLAIGRALMASPKLLLLDEPLLGLSPAYQEIVVNGTKAIRDSKGISIIITEQYARPVMPIIDYGYILENGSSVLTGTREELLDNPDVKSAYFGV
ncbi:MAG: High-affinity branched-chain amino acid transport ATP-binding protein LivF [Syntrophorhabdus sp. PtaB.Bin047]|jgi:branched-chain amino acid transport system ATP-binding protein|nr:MAG: High-affinity branched-chain amino acid transport ATP-binding protein LivF [Syntrophorhabdus sp. PtaB.Bin047]